MPDMRELLDGLFVEMAIIEHLTRTRVEQYYLEDMDVGCYGILGYLIRQAPTPSTIGTIAWTFQEEEARVTGQIETLTSRGYVAVTAGLKPADSVVTLTAAGNQARQDALDRMAPEFMQIVSEIPRDDLVVAFRVLKDIRLVLDNLPGR